MSYSLGGTRSEKLAPESKGVLQGAVKIINCTKSNALNSCLFSNIDKNVDFHNTNLLLHAEVRWMFREESLRRLLSFEDEIEIFFNRTKMGSCCFFSK